MQREIIIEKYPWENRIAILEDGDLVEIWCDDREEKVGNIYKGRVEDVVPGLSCAFVNIGLERNAFLYVADIAVPEGIKEQNIANLIRPGQEPLVQVRKEAFQEKGARVTTHITLPGRFIVLLPFKDDVSVSRKIEDSVVRQRLKNEIINIKPLGVGVIIRTAAATATLREIESELNDLYRLWQAIYQGYKEKKAPALLYEDASSIERVLRDYLDGTPTLVITNDDSVRRDILAVLGGKLPSGVAIRMETGDVFGRRNLDREIKRALKRRVWLKSGGFIVIDETEAMTVIDVNSGKFTGQENLEQTILHINLEAAREIPRQLRLRSLGGIILIDFIDMEKEEHQEQVLKLLQTELDKDKAHTRVLGLTRLGFLEMTRKRSRYGVRDYFTRTCSYCNGSGVQWKDSAVLNEVKRRLVSLNYLRTGMVNLEVSPRLQAVVEGDVSWPLFLSGLKQEVRIVVNPDLAEWEYRVSY